jgi:hypothetical protein
MNRILVSLLIGAIALSGWAADKKPKHAALASDTVVWAGLDFTKVKMIGPGQFTQPENIFPGMMTAWNNLFLQERLRFVEKQTKKRVLPDTAGVTEANMSATAKQIIESPGPEDTIDQTHISEKDIARAVKSYRMGAKEGLGVVMIADRFVKYDNKGKGAVYVVAFDVASRDVILSQREIHNGTGFGFRNYWFRVFKDSEDVLAKLRN